MSCGERLGTFRVLKDSRKGYFTHMTDADPKWKRFEKLVAKVQQDLAPKATVTHNDKIAGKVIPHSPP